MPAGDELLPAIKRLISDMVAEVSSDDETSVEEYLDIAETCPIIGAALQVIALLGVGMLGEFSHPDEDSQAMIRRNFEQMQGSLALSVEEQMSAFPLGYAASQWGVEMKNGERSLIDIQILNPTLYSFEGKRGSVEAVKFRDANQDVLIPYSGEKGRIIHVINGRHLAFRDPTGIAALKRVVATHKAWKILMGEMLVAGQRQATPIIVGYSNSGAMVPMLDANGEPLLDSQGSPVMIQAPKALLEQLQAIDNRSVISTDINNKIEALNQATGGAFFFEALRLLQQLKLLGLIMPESVLIATGVGDSNLNKGQRSTLGLVLSSLVNQIKEGLLNGPVRWLLTWNKGEQETYGSFPEPEQEDDNQIALLGALTNAVQTGWFSAADLAVLNRGRQLAGIPATDTAGTNSAVSMGRSLYGLDLNWLETNGNGHSRAN